MKLKAAQSCPTLRPLGLRPAKFLCPWVSPGKNTAVGGRSLLQGIFPTHRLNPGLPHCRRNPYPLSYQGGPLTTRRPNNFRANRLHLNSSILWVEAKADRKDRATTQIQVSRFLIHQHITFSGKSTLGKGVRNKEGKLFKSHLLFSRQFLAIRGASGSVLSQLSMAL